MTRFDREMLCEMSGFVADHLGLDFPEERFPDLARGIEATGRELGFPRPDALRGWLTTGAFTARQIETLASHLTVGETYFLRDPATFEALEREILPPLVATRAHSGRNLRFWSAGCSSGEEAYSIGIACARALPDLRTWNVSVLATDINPTVLAKAEAGAYSEWSFRGAPTWLRERFFSATPDKKLAIDPGIRKLVHFGYLNLVADAYPSVHNGTNAMDVIFCRNVLMYLTPDHRSRVVSALHGCLVDGGYLLVNPAEASSSLFPMFAMESADGVILYRKTAQPTGVHAVAAYLPTAATLPPETTASVERAVPIPPAARILPAAPTPPPGVPQHETLLAVARSYANQGRLEEALAACQEAIATHRTDLAARYLHAMICRELGQVDDAVAGLGKVLYLDQDFVLAHHALGGLCRQLGKKRASRRHLAIALQLLGARDKDEIVPESDGMTCGRLEESARVMMGA